MLHAAAATTTINHSNIKENTSIKKIQQQAMAVRGTNQFSAAQGTLSNHKKRKDPDVNQECYFFVLLF